MSSSNTIAPSSIYIINASVCNDVANVIWKPNEYDYFPAFQNTLPIRMAHRGVPRGGHSNDVLNVVLGDREQAQDYVTGLLISSILILIFFGGWITILILLKCMGRNRVAWLSGKRKKLPAKPTTVHENDETHNMDTTDEKEKPSNPHEEGNPQDVDHNNAAAAAAEKEELPPNAEPSQVYAEHQDIAIPAQPKEEYKTVAKTPTEQNDDPNASTVPPQTMEEWEDLFQTKMKQQLWLKGVTIVACLTVIAMAILMATKGVQSLQGSLTYGTNSVRYAQVLLNAADHTVGGLSLFLKTFQSDMQTFLIDINQICPNVKTFICENLMDVGTCNTTGIFGDTEQGQELSETFEELVQFFYQDWTIVTQLEDLRRDLQNVARSASHVEEQISTIDWVFYIAIFFDLLVALMALVMIVHLLLQREQRQCPWFVNCMHHRCLFPVYILFVLFSFIFAIAFLITSLVLSDT